MAVTKNPGKVVIRMGLALISLSLLLAWSPPARTAEGDIFHYLPLVMKPQPESISEVRGVWVSRFDWTRSGQAADPAKIDEIVANVAGAGFNVIFFQVRGTADAYYQSDLEPWATRISGVALGQAPDPLWDPLAYMVTAAHNAGVQVHAYFNVYPLWSDPDGGGDCLPPPDETVTPEPLYHALSTAHGKTGEKLNGAQWHTTGEVLCDAYLRASPASTVAVEHYLAVAQDLVTRYDVDGLHLDHIRYGSSTTSCDPASLCSYNGLGESCDPVPLCVLDDDYKDWQRQQVDELVRRFYEEIVPLKEGVWLSAAVWPVYEVKPEWGWQEYYQQGYHTYYQDSKGWLAGEYIDSISPMIYPGGVINCPDDNIYWTQERWRTLVTDFEADSNGRFIIPGIAAGYCTFDEIEARIEMAREIGVAGHALFSYRGLTDYFDDLAAGPYVIPATVPEIAWHP